MRSILVTFVVLTIALSTNAQVIRSCGSNLLSPLIASSPLLASAPYAAPLVGPNTVATSLADTLSLLTVSSLLAEKLPLGYPIAAPSFGCGCNGPIGYPYVL